MEQATVSLDAQDHLVGEDANTLCGKPVPMGTTQIEGTDPCPVCFPDAEQPKAAKAKKAKKAE